MSTHPSCPSRLYRLAHTCLGPLLFSASVIAQDLALLEEEDGQTDPWLERLTLEENAGQLTALADNISSWNPHTNPDVKQRRADELLAELPAGRVGVLFNGRGIKAARLAQHAAAEESRMKIP